MRYVLSLYFICIYIHSYISGLNAFTNAKEHYNSIINIQEASHNTLIAEHKEIPLTEKHK